jgi:ATP-dependent RNA helicase RhlE
LVEQVVETIKQLTEFLSVKVLGVYGGVNINTQAVQAAEGCHVLVGTPGRLYDLALSRAISLKNTKKLVIDEVDVMLDLGFRFQLTNIFELLPEKRQNIMFSATMTDDVAALIEDFFFEPQTIAIALSGTPLDNIEQVKYPVPNFYTKVNLLADLISDKSEFKKVLVFAPSKKNADRMFEVLEPQFGNEMGVIHSNKSQNYRFRSINQFEDGTNRILIATDIMARGMDIDSISHVISFDVPNFPENYMHRIGRTGRAEQKGKSILFYTPKEEEYKNGIEYLMVYEIPELEMPEHIEISGQLLPEERTKYSEKFNRNRKKNTESGAAFHEKKDKNKKVNLGGSYRRELAKKYKKALTKGDKHFNRRNKKKK